MGSRFKCYLRSQSARIEVKRTSNFSNEPSDKQVSWRVEGRLATVCSPNSSDVSYFCKRMITFHYDESFIGINTASPAFVNQKLNVDAFALLPLELIQFVYDLLSEIDEQRMCAISMASDRESEREQRISSCSDDQKSDPNKWWNAPDGKTLQATA